MPCTIATRREEARKMAAPCRQRCRSSLVFCERRQLMRTVLYLRPQPDGMNPGERGQSEQDERSAFLPQKRLRPPQGRTQHGLALS